MRKVLRTRDRDLKAVWETSTNSRQSQIEIKAGNINLKLMYSVLFYKQVLHPP